MNQTISIGRGDLTNKISKWVLVDQAMINRFAEVTRDPDPMHINPEWCDQNSPFGGTIAFGFLTMSLLTHMMQDIVQYECEDRQESDGIPINYGFNKLRMITPVPVNSRIRLCIRSTRSEIKGSGQILQTIDLEIQVEGKERPAIVAEWLTMWVEPGEGVAALRSK